MDDESLYRLGTTIDREPGDLALALLGDAMLEERSRILGSY